MVALAMTHMDLACYGTQCTHQNLQFGASCLAVALAICRLALALDVLCIFLELDCLILQCQVQ